MSNEAILNIGPSYDGEVSFYDGETAVKEVEKIDWKKLGKEDYDKVYERFSSMMKHNGLDDELALDAEHRFALCGNQPGRDRECRVWIRAPQHPEAEAANLGLRLPAQYTLCSAT